MKAFTHKDMEPLATDAITVELDGERFYRIQQAQDEEPLFLPSVTTILKAKGKPKEVIDWEKNVGAEKAAAIVKESSEIGHYFHYCIEKYLQNSSAPMPNEFTELKAYNLFNSVMPYLDNIDNIHYQEQRLYSELFGVAGCADCIAEYNSVLSIVDFKNARKRRKDNMVFNYFLQCTAYAGLYQAMTGTPVNQGVILMAVADGTIQQWVFDTRKYVRPLVEAIKAYKAKNVVSVYNGQAVVYRQGYFQSTGPLEMDIMEMPTNWSAWVDSDGNTGSSIKLPDYIKPGGAIQIHNNSNHNIRIYQ